MAAVFVRTGRDGTVREMVAHTPADEVRLKFAGWALKKEEPTKARTVAPVVKPKPADPDKN